MVPRSNELFQLNNIRVKDHDKALIYTLIYNNEIKSRKEILSKYKIRPTIITQAVKELKNDGLILEERQIQSRPGRPEIILKANFDRLVAVAMYVESRELKCAMVNLGGNVLHEYSETVPKDADSEEFLNKCRRILNTVLHKMPANSQLSGIGISPSGSIDHEKKVWISTYRWPQIRNVEFSKLSKEYNCEIYVRKDLDSLLDYHLEREPIYRKGNTILFHWGFGVGFAYAQNGININTSFLRFGEIGHTRFDLSSTKPCICGATGCIETETAIWALLPELKSLDSTLMDDETVVLDFSRQHPEVCTLPGVQNALHVIITAFVNLYRLFYPSHVLLLGPLFSVQKIYEEFTERVNREIKNFSVHKLDYYVIPDGYRGCIFTNTRQVFYNKLKEMLRAKF